MSEAPPPNPVSALQHAAGVLRDIANHVDISNVGRYKWLAIRAADRADTSLAAIKAATPAKAKRWKAKCHAATD